MNGVDDFIDRYQIATRIFYAHWKKLLFVVNIIICVVVVVIVFLLDLVYPFFHRSVFPLQFLMYYPQGLSNLNK